MYALPFLSALDGTCAHKHGVQAIAQPMIAKMLLPLPAAAGTGREARATRGKKR